MHGKEVSYNNILVLMQQTNLMLGFMSMSLLLPSKHNNACGFASREKLVDAYEAALAGDPVSAFGGVLIANKPINLETAEKVNELFCEVVIAPAFEEQALNLLKSKKNRILLLQKRLNWMKKSVLVSTDTLFKTAIM